MFWLVLMGGVLVVLRVSEMDQLFQMYNCSHPTNLKTLQVFLKLLHDLLKYSLKCELQ